MWTKQAHGNIHPSTFSKHSLTLGAGICTLPAYQEMLPVSPWPRQMQTISWEEMLMTLLNAPVAPDGCAHRSQGPVWDSCPRSLYIVPSWSQCWELGHWGQWQRSGMFLLGQQALKKQFQWQQNNGKPSQGPLGDWSHFHFSFCLVFWDNTWDGEGKRRTP